MLDEALLERFRRGERRALARLLSLLARGEPAGPTLAQLGPPSRPSRVIAITGRFVLSLRRLGQTYSNAVVEKHLGVPATTRNWNTIEAIRDILQPEVGASS